MQWSKLKQTVESRFADSVTGRVRLYLATYRAHHDHPGRGWIEIDGEEMASFSDHAGPSARYGSEHTRSTELLVGPESAEAARRAGHLTRAEFTTALRAYLDLSIDDCLAASCIVIRALAMIDRRLGKRRLKTISVSEDEHPLIGRLLALRCEVEDVTHARQLGDS